MRDWGWNLVAVVGILLIAGELYLLWWMHHLIIEGCCKVP